MRSRSGRGMRTVLLGPQRFRTTVGAAIRTVAPEGTVATVTAGWRDRESDTDELDATLEGRGRHLRLYGRLTDVLDSDQRFAEAALAHRDAVDELAGIYSLRLQRALDSVYTVQRRTVRTDVAASAEADGVRVVQSIDQWYLDAVDQLHGELQAAAPPEESEPIQRHRAEVAEAVGQASAIAIAGGHVGQLLRCLKLFAGEPPATAAGRCLVRRRDESHRASRALPRPGAQRGGRLRGLGPRARTGAADRGDAARPTPPADGRPDGAPGPGPPVRRRPLPPADDGARVVLGPNGELPAEARVIGDDGIVHTLGENP